MGCNPWLRIEVSWWLILLEDPRYTDHLTPACEAEVPTEMLSPLTSELEWILQQERKRLHDLILTNPRQAAIELDVEHLSWYPARPDKPQFTLAELHSFYLEHKRNKQGKPLGKKHKDNSKRWWKEFLMVVGVKNYRELTLDQIRAYKTIVMTPFDKDKASASYVRNRFAKVKAVFNFGLQECEEHDKPEFRRVLDLCLILRHPAEEVNPRPIPTDAFTKLLAVAPPRETAILLLGANCLLHSGEAATTLKADCDLDAGTLSARRTKNRRPRVAKLWNRTVEAIREYQRLNPHHSEYLFVGRTGNPPNVRQQFMTLRKNAGLPKDVTFEGLRDAAYTVAEETDAHHAKFVAGHKAGMSDKYVLRQATNKKVVACCEAVEEHFFGENE